MVSRCVSVVVSRTPGDAVVGSVPPNFRVGNVFPKMVSFSYGTRATVFVSLLMFSMLPAHAAPASKENLNTLGVAMIPKDAAFVSCTLRLQEQIDLIAGSNAVAAIKNLPAVARALAELEEQQSQPGSPLSMIATFMELPENQEAVELLTNMVASDVFVYGEPSCIKVLDLLKKLQSATQKASVLEMIKGSAESGLGGFEGLNNSLPEEEMEEDDEDDAAVASKRRFQLARFQPADDEEQLSAQEIQSKIIIQTLADNLDAIMVPDIVWGFKTSKLETGKKQLKRLEVLVKLFTQGQPQIAERFERKKLENGEVFTLTVSGDMLPLGAIDPSQFGNNIEGFDKVIDRLKELNFVLALGYIGDRVVISIGNSVDHLNKIVLADGKSKGLLFTKPFAPLLEIPSRKFTGISYISNDLAEALAPSSADIRLMLDVSEKLIESADLPAEAAKDAERGLQKIVKGYEKLLPKPGPWMAFSFLGDQGYEGYSWSWSENLFLDASKRLELLEHVGGAPLAAIVYRTKTDSTLFEELVSLGGMIVNFSEKYLVSKASEDDQEKFQTFSKTFGPLVEKLTDIFRKNILPSMKDGQVGLVLDSKSKVTRLHKELPASDEPLPLLEPAIVIGLSDAKLFREGLSDLFVLADDLVTAVQKMDGNTVPKNYKIPEPEKTKIANGTVWSFNIDKSGIDSQIQPAIAVTTNAAIFSLVPKQAERLLAQATLETGSEISDFQMPLAAAATLDFSGVIDFIEPWFIYVARYVSVQQQNGEVDSSLELDADTEEGMVRDVLQQSPVVFDALRTLRAATAETTRKSDAWVTHWKNVIRDIPASTRK